MTLFAFNSFILADLEFAPDQVVMFEGCDSGDIFAVSTGCLIRGRYDGLRHI